MIENGLKYCRVCGETKPVSEFGKLTQAKDGLNWWCLCCERERSKFRVSTPEKRKSFRRKQRYSAAKILYGLSKAEYEFLVFDSVACPICKRPFSEDQIPVIDHDHLSGGVRGAICSSCNFAMGLAEDDIVVLREAVRYLTERDE
jgi:hypothetical protein